MTVKTKVSRFHEVFLMVSFSLLVLVLPFNVVYHFNSQFAYVDGYFVNYLDFVVHIIDIAVVVILFWAIAGQKVYKSKPFLAVSGLTICMYGVHCLIFRDWIVVYSAARLLMYVVAGVALYMAGGKPSSPLKNAEAKRGLIIVLLLSAALQSVIAIFQFSLNHSLGLKALGESIVQVGAFNTSSVYLPDGFHLRGYGTFPHPNILGGFLVVSLIFIFREIVDINWRSKKCGIYGRIYEVGLLAGVLMILAGIFVTWSRVAWILAILQIVVWGGYFLKRTGSSIKTYVLTVVIFGGLSLIWLMSSGDSLSFAVRERLVTQTSSSAVSVEERRELKDRAVGIMKESLVTGVGVGRFIPVLAGDPVYTASGIRLMQPVHNVFMLVFSEVGLMGILSMAGFGTLLWCKKLKMMKSLVLFSLIATFFFIGMFDHYLWSLPQGLALWILLPPVLLRTGTG